MPQLKVQNQYKSTITSPVNATGDINFTVTTPPIYTNGFIVVSPDISTQREVMYFHDVIGSTIYVRSENRISPKGHTSTEAIQINDVAEIFNTFSDMISQAFYVEKTGGLNIKVWGGYVLYNGNQVAVADTNLTLTDNATNYIKYIFNTNTISVDTSNTGNIKAVVTTLAGLITSIVYRFSKESLIDFTVALTGALPSQAGNASKALITNGTTVNWGVLPIETVNASTTVAGKVELPTIPEMQSNTQIGDTGAALALSPAQMGSYYSKGDGIDGSIVFDGATTILGMVPSGNVYTMTRDIYTINLTVNTGISINPNGYAIYSNGTMTLSGTAKIIRTGNAASGATGGAALNTGTCGINNGGGTGGAGGFGGAIGGSGGAGVSVSPSYATTGTTAPAGGPGGVPFGGANTGGGGPGGVAGVATQGVLYNIKYSLANLLAQLILPARGIINYITYGTMPSSGGGGGGNGNGSGNNGGNGGGSGGNGGIIMIFANIIAGIGTISAVGGIGAVGSAGASQGAGGGGGSGGSGGLFYLVYNSGTPWTATLTGGAAGLGSGAGANGSTGITGQSIIINV